MSVTRRPAVRKPLFKFDVRSSIITDHRGNDVRLAWYPTRDGQYPPDQPPPFPFQVYFTQDAAPVANDPDFAATLICLVEDRNGWYWGREPVHARFEFYTISFSNVLACIAHQREEILHRNRNGIYPQLARRWGTWTVLYDGKILVVDRPDFLYSDILLAEYNPLIYQHGRQLLAWYLADDLPVVTTSRVPVTATDLQKSLPGKLQDWWNDAGGSWTEADLARRNEGAVSPALYPAVDPVSHYDVEHEAVHELDGTALPPPGVADDDEDDDTDDQEPKIIDTFDKRELFRADADLPHLQSEIYCDLLDEPVTSVWNRLLSKTRPDFSFTLYIEYGVLPLRPKALFTCLNKDLIAESSWTLDVVRNMPSIEAAFDYHARNTERRSVEKLVRLRASSRLVLDKINNERLPAELLDLIEDMLVPPAIPNYSRRPLRPHRDMFLYLDAGHLSTGPLLVYSNQMPFQFGEDLQTSKHESYDSDVRDVPLKVEFLRFWHRVADEMHVIWSLCSPRLTLSDAELPRITLKLEIPDQCFIHQDDPWNIDEEPSEHLADPRVSLRLDSQHPITLHTIGLFSHDLWTEALELVDVDTGEVLPRFPCTRTPQGHGDSWLQSRELGFRKDHSPEGWQMQTLRPGQWTPIRTLYSVGGFEAWLKPRADAGVLRHGRRYALRLVDDVVVPRWTYGVVDERKGPYNLPPLPVKVEGGEGRFTFEWRGRP